MDKTATYTHLKGEHDRIAQQRDQKQRKGKKDGEQYIPNRRQMRSDGIGVKTFTDSMFSRITSGTRLTPCSLQTMVAIHQLREDGTVHKFIIPRSKLVDQRSQDVNK